jgi:hypothetical protein
MNASGGRMAGRIAADSAMRRAMDEERTALIGVPRTTRQRAYAVDKRIAATGRRLRLRAERSRSTRRRIGP